MTPRAERSFGFAEWFRPHEHERVRASLEHLEAIGAPWLRSHLSWAEYHKEGGREWYDWLIPTLAERVELLPCIHYTPPSLSRTGTTAGAPHDLRALADFVDHILDRYGRHFPRVELWNEPNNLLDWDWRADPNWDLFSEMVGAAAYWSQHRGWPAILGAPCPFDLNWLDLMGARGVLGVVSGLSIHGFPGTWDSETGVWGGWKAHITQTRELLARYNPKAEVWITEAGYSTWRHDEAEQARRFLDAFDAPAERLYWYALADLPPSTPIQEGRRFDVRHYHMGVLDVRGRDKLLARLLRAGGVPAVRRKVQMTRSGTARTGRPILITGGAGFIGSNLADALLRQGEEVIIFDNFSRPGVSANLEWLRAKHGRRALVHAADVRDQDAVSEAVNSAVGVFHFAAQVAVTDSIEWPLEDFAINAAGTLHLLEALRHKREPTPLVFASTNKVYGCLDNLPMLRGNTGYIPRDETLTAHGIDETQPLALATPYGCSKGAADQYVQDYAKTFELPAVVIRMSCVYGPRQFGTEDQGWVSHFLLKALRDEPITIFGDGHQVRDILHVDDAVRAYQCVYTDIDALSGRAFNLGGGPGNAVSLLSLLAHIEKLLGRSVERTFQTARTGDQLYFVADTHLLRAATGWQPEIRWTAGIEGLIDWLRQHRLSSGRPSDRKEWSLSA